MCSTNIWISYQVALAKHCPWHPSCPTRCTQLSMLRCGRECFPAPHGVTKFFRAPEQRCSCPVSCGIYTNPFRFLLQLVPSLPRVGGWGWARLINTWQVLGSYHKPSPEKPPPLYLSCDQAKTVLVGSCFHRAWNLLGGSPVPGWITGPICQRCPDMSEFHWWIQYTLYYI